MLNFQRISIEFEDAKCAFTNTNCEEFAVLVYLDVDDIFLTVSFLKVRFVINLLRHRFFCIKEKKLLFVDYNEEQVFLDVRDGNDFCNSLTFTCDAHGLTDVLV